MIRIQILNTQSLHSFTSLILRCSMDRFSKFSGIGNKLMELLLAICFLVFTQKIQAQTGFPERGNPDINSCLISFSPTSGLEQARSLKLKGEKGSFIYNRLREHSIKSQLRVRKLLDAGGYSYRCYSIANVISADLDSTMIARLWKMDEVISISENTPVRVPDDREVRFDIDPASRNLEDLPWGLSLIEADKVWDLGYRGQGVVVGGHDTGVDWQHPALINNYRGWNGVEADHNYHWHDAIHEISPLHRDSVITASTNPCGLSVREPCDDAASSHGTHTTGTMVGYDVSAGMTVGVAPEARWIGVRNMERGFGSVASYLEGFQWFLAPTDLNNENPDPDQAPDIINNSWACIELEGCDSTNFSILETAISNLKLAGIMVVASAGNSGTQGCSTIDNPAAIYEESMTVGSIDMNDSLSSFSSKGPVSVDGSFRLKPNVTAPGRGVLSSIKGGRYGLLTGTSMAGPHVAGLAALIISARPDLRGQVEMIEDIIESSAIPKPDLLQCSPDDQQTSPNMSHGFGRINALLAIQEAINLVTPVRELAITDEWLLFPNPVRDLLTIRSSRSDYQGTLDIFDIIGRKMNHINKLISVVSIDVSHWPEGIYIARIHHEANNVSYKLFRIIR